MAKIVTLLQKNHLFWYRKYKTANVSKTAHSPTTNTLDWGIEMPVTGFFATQV